MKRRTFLHGAAAVGAAAMLPRRTWAAADLKPIYQQVEKRHDEALARLQDWIRQPTIAAESRGITEGRDLTMRLLREAGFGKVESVSTDGHPGIFATLDAGAPRTIGLYFMYDVKQVDPKEWSSPPWEAKLVDLPKLGKVVMGRGAVNQKGPEATFLAALHAIRGAGKKLPVNLVFVAEGEEEIGSPRAGGAQALRGRLHAARQPERRRHGDDQPRRQGRGRVRAGVERGHLGPRAQEGHPLEQPRPGRQPGVAPGAGAQHAGDADRRAGDRRPVRQGPAAR
jgi:hypothetical protein